VDASPESGHSWAAIGGLLGFGALAAGDGATVADYAFDYTTGPRAAAAWFDTPVFMWVCRACGQMISDRGPGGCPADDEAGHVRGCPHLAVAVAEWNASRW
jgi:hypothetical protein